MARRHQSRSERGACGHQKLKVGASSRVVTHTEPLPLSSRWIAAKGWCHPVTVRGDGFTTHFRKMIPPVPQLQSLHRVVQSVYKVYDLVVCR